jgi:uncharacterized RDD family membrane protein YckC
MAPAGYEEQVAPLGRRAAAAAIDSGLVAAGVGMAIGAGIGIAVAADRGLVQVGERLKRLGDRVSTGVESQRVSRIIDLASFAASVHLRNARSPGMKVMHLRRADARSGGPVTVRSVVIRQLVWLASGRISARVWRPGWGRYQARLKELHTEFQEFRRQHPDDKEAEMAFYSSHKGAVPTSCCAVMAANLVLQRVPALLTPRRQNLADWVAGIVVVSD